MTPISRIVHDAVQANVRKQTRKRTGYEKLLPYTIRTLLFLVKCAEDGKTTDYSSVSTAIGINNTRSANVGFGPIREILHSLSEHPESCPGIFAEVPDITSIVTHAGSRTCGEGFFQEDAPLDERVEQRRVFEFERWQELLKYLEIEQPE